MASSKHHQVHVFLTIFLFCSSLFCFTPDAASDLVHQECMHAPQVVSRLNPDRCVALLSTDPKALKATTLKELAVIGLELGMKEATEVLAQVNAGMSKASPELKSVLNAVASQVKLVDFSFKSARAEVKEDNDFESANYDCFLVSDYITAAREELKKAKEKVDPSYETSIDTLSDFGLINYVITNDA